MEQTASERRQIHHMLEAIGHLKIVGNHLDELLSYDDTMDWLESVNDLHDELTKRLRQLQYKTEE